jgi:hypothetical protein
MNQPKTAVIRILKTGELITVRSYGSGWIDAKGNMYHRTTAELVNVCNE